MGLWQILGNMEEMMENTCRGKRLAKYVPDYVVFDLETTGISWMKDDIIEISAVKVKKGAVIDTYSTLVNPCRSIPCQATRVNGITDEMVADAPGLETALQDFLAFSGEYIFVGHNIASFDLKFIYNETQKLFGKTVDNDYIDTLHMAKSCLPQLKHYKLVDLAEYFQISAKGAHRALNDCIMNQKCYEELGKIQAEIPFELCPECGGELIKRKGRFGEFFGCGNYPKCRYTKNIR